ncbi:murein biosynthesis integral membrane protein MurJ [Leucobacter sp. PH1c]|uniref:murein biosynthesis integral membrane protein MurJ n=1 Tax=Leucobacter sp. PH1c TaxID=1397278 RepID=UPI0009DEC34A|nr:lipid II flippase MurJ [Leucobacter sp. PH1c]
MLKRRSGDPSAGIAAATLVSRLLGVARSLLLATAIGSTGVWANSFATANQLPNSIYTLIATGAISSVLVPQVSRAMVAPEHGQRYINRLLTLTLLTATAVCALTLILTPTLIALLGSTWESPEQIHLATVLAFWLVPQVILFSMFSALGEVLNAQSMFLPFAWAPALSNLIALGGLAVFVVLFGADPDGLRPAAQWGPLAQFLIAGSATAGVLAQVVLLLAALRRASIRFRLDFRFRGAGLGTTAKLAGWTFFAIVIAQLVLLLTIGAMNRAGAEDAGVAAWQLTSLIIVLPHSILIMSFVTSRFSTMSQQALEGKLIELAGEIARLLRRAGIAMFFFSAVMIPLAMPTIRVVMFRASSETVTTVSLVLAAGAVGCAAFSGLFVLNRGFYALSNTRTPAIVQICEAALAAAGIALSFIVDPAQVTWVITLWLALLLWVEVIITYALFRKRLPELAGQRIVHDALRAFASAILAGGTAWIVALALGGGSPTGFLLSGPIEAITGSIFATVAALLVYVPSLILLGHTGPRTWRRGLR